MTAVATWRATTEQKAAALAALPAQRIVSGLTKRDPESVAIVGALYKLATGRAADPTGARRRQFQVELDEVKAAVGQGRLLFLEGWELKDAESPVDDATEEPGSPEERLVRQAMGDRKTLAFEDRRYRFVPARLWTQAVNQGRYAIVPLAEAGAVVARLSQRSTGTAEEKALWAEMTEQLSDTRGGDGLLLLRDRPPQQAVATPLGELPITPSQLRPKIAEKDWIEVEVLFEDGSPFDGNCCVALPGGKKSNGPPGEAGVIRIDELDPGDCKVTFPELDSPVFSPA